MDENIINSEKSFQIELKSNSNNSYSIIFNLNNSIEITSNQINGIINKSYSSKYSFEEIRENNYFLRFNSIIEIFDEIKDKIFNNKVLLKENENRLIINLPLPENKEIIFELQSIIKNNIERLNELTNLIIKLNSQMNNNNEEIIKLKQKMRQLSDENKQLKNEIDDFKDKEIRLMNEKNNIINDINFLKNDNMQLKDNEAKLINENIQLKEEIISIKEKVNVLSLLKENLIINNLDSKILEGNENYVRILKNWINPSKKIKAELLYRLSENGDKFSTFHELCDNKGPTLTLFHVNDGNIVGIYTPLSWDTNSEWKNDMDTFIFNLNKNKKCKKNISDCSIYCNGSYGPYTINFGHFRSNTMKYINHWSNEINKYYDKGSEILPNNSHGKFYELIESEVYKIMIE